MISNTSTNRFGGVALLVHKSIQHTQIFTNFDFETVAIEIDSLNKTVFSSYISPSTPFTYNNLNNVFNLPNSRIIITGDFNSWHPTWGSTRHNRRGTIIHKYITTNNLILLNDKSPTHFTTHNTFTHIDLSLCPSNLATYTKWTRSDDLSGSDHFPLILDIFEIPQHPALPRSNFKLNKANWELYVKLLPTFDNTIPVSKKLQI